MKYEKQREKLIELIVNAKRADPETESFTEFLADFLLGYGVFVPLDDYDPDHLRELVEADRDGRCVVMPVKPGTVWVANKWSHEPVEVYYPSVAGIISDMERGCVFGNTKEEAQVALAALKGDSDG